MDRAWRLARPFTVRELHDELKAERTIAYTTVMTVMDNLRKKGWLRRRAQGRAYHYEPTVSGEQYSAGVMRQALAAAGDRAAALTHFIGELSAEEADALDEAYRRHTGKKASEAGG